MGGMLISPANASHGSRARSREHHEEHHTQRSDATPHTPRPGRNRPSVALKAPVPRPRNGRARSMYRLSLRR